MSWKRNFPGSESGLFGFGWFVTFIEDRVVDRAADVEREGELAIFQSSAGHPRKQIGYESLLGSNGRNAVIVQLVGPGEAHRAGAVNVHAIAIDVDEFAGKLIVAEFQVGGDKVEQRE